MQKRICPACKQELSIDSFNFKNKKKGLRHVTCRTCSRNQVRNHYNNNKKYYYDKNVSRRLKMQEDAGEKILAYLLDHPCVDCGEANPLVLQFDHLHSKKANVSWMKTNARRENVEKEIQKCEVRCANCHSIKTAKQRKTWLYKKLFGL